MNAGQLGKGHVKFLPLAWTGMPKTSFSKNSDSLGLVKVNCQHCLAIGPVDTFARQSLNVSQDEVIYHGTSCKQCNETGVVGRMAVYELLRIDPSIKAIIKPEVATTDIHQHALASGMIPLTDNALLRARAKDISLAEVYRIRLD